jgi:hypothetical protein
MSLAHPTEGYFEELVEVDAFSKSASRISHGPARVGAEDRPRVPGRGRAVTTSRTTTVAASPKSTSSNTTDPGLASTLANNGGPTKTIALLLGSPAFNAIPQGQSRCATATGRIATDQRGVRRPQGPACDVGAYERARSLP